MKTRYKIIIGIIVACLAVAAGIWMEVRRGRQMRAAVEQALEQNRNGIPFTSDTVSFTLHSSFFTFHDSLDQRVSLRRAVAYYDHPLRRLWTSPNDRLRAGYALGCVYRDLHEAPIAIITWEDAIAAADTTAADCDYATLFRVYGQMANMYMWQHLPEKQLDAQIQMSHYAFMAGDTLNHLRGQLLLNSVYYALGDTAAIFANSEAVRQQFLDLGLTQEAAKVYPTPIHVAVEHCQYERARRMIDEYEHNSGLFEGDGFITDPTRAQYHFFKGMFYLGCNNIDSAENQFRWLLKIKDEIVDAHRGLLAVYQQRAKSDSIIKYSRLLEESLIAHQKSIQSTAIVQAQGMYDYHRQQENAVKQRHRGDRMLFLLFAVSIFAIIIISLFFRHSCQRKREVRNLFIKYSNTLRDMEVMENELAILHEHLNLANETTMLLQAKEEEYKLLQERSTEYENLFMQLRNSEKLAALEQSDIVHLFREISIPKSERQGATIIKQSPRMATPEEWEAMEKAVKQCLPLFYTRISEKLSEQEFRLCMLSRLSFNASEIANLLGTSSSRVSNAKKSASQKLFGVSEANMFIKNLKKI